MVQSSEEAANRIMTAAETIAAALDRGEPKAVLQEQLSATFEACAFQDLAGQRISKIERILAGEIIDDSGLENGPALSGRGLGQAAADALFE